MNWINLKISIIREPAYVGAEPVQRATWLNLLAYCCEHENGGVIKDAAAWKCRQWQQTCGVMLEEVRSECDLWGWCPDGALIVAMYPVEKQHEVQAKRDAGARGGRARASRASSKSQAQLQADSKHSFKQTFNGKEGEEELELETELEEKKEESKGAAAATPAPAPKEIKAKRARFAKPTVEEWTEYARTMPNPLTENQAIGAWDHYEANGWRVGRNPMVDWRASLRKWGSNQREFSQASRPQHKPPVSRNGSGFTMTEQQRIDLDADSLPDNI